MYQVVSTKRYSKSFQKLERSGKLSPKARKDLNFAINQIREGKALPRGFVDHQLKGELAPFRECHIRGDLLLLYQIKDQELVLLLIDIGSHSYLFG